MSYQPGEIILRNRPWIHVLEEKYANVYCHNCFRRPIDFSDVPLKRCTQCLFAHYCNESCAKASWRDHKIECKELKRYRAENRDIPECNIRLIARLMCKLSRGEKSDPPDACWPPSSRTYDDLCTHADQIETTAIQITAFTYTIAKVVNFLGKENMLKDKPSILNAYSKVVVNAMTLYDGSQPYGIGAALPLGATRFDHACKPNADYMIRNNNGCEVVVRALEPIKSIDDVRICYINPMEMTSRRCAIIQEHYYFHCDCEFCLDSHRDNMMRSARCPKTKCNGAIPLTEQFQPDPCTGCKSLPDNGNKFGEKAALMMVKVNDEVTKYEELFGTKDSMNSADQTAKQTEAYRGLLKVHEEAKELLYPLNIFYIKLIVHLAGNETALERKLYLEETNAYRYYYGLSSFLGIRLVLQAGQQIAAQQFDEAEKSLQEAERILRVTHGTDHPMYKDMINVKDKQLSKLKKMGKLAQNASKLALK